MLIQVWVVGSEVAVSLQYPLEEIVRSRTFMLDTGTVPWPSVAALAFLAFLLTVACDPFPGVQVRVINGTDRAIEEVRAIDSDTAYELIENAIPGGQEATSSVILPEGTYVFEVLFADSDVSESEPINIGGFDVYELTISE